jgi:hypothetical protein
MGKLAGGEWLDKALVMQVAVEPAHESLLAAGFRPAYYDYATGAVHASRHADGSPSLSHTIEGLPDEAVAVRACGRVVAAKGTLLAGYERGGFFYTRRAAARAAAQWGGAG